MNPESCVYFLSEQPEGGMPEKQFANLGKEKKWQRSSSTPRFSIEGMLDFSIGQEDVLEGNQI